MNEQELNRKLAKWRWPGVKTSLNVLSETAIKVFLPYEVNEEVDFTQSPGTCLKWLVPKLHTTHSIYMHIGKTLTTCVISPYFNHPGSQSYEAQNGSPVLAFCLTVEKLIDNK